MRFDSAGITKRLANVRGETVQFYKIKQVVKVRTRTLLDELGVDQKCYQTREQVECYRIKRKRFVESTTTGNTLITDLWKSGINWRP